MAERTGGVSPAFWAALAILVAGFAAVAFWLWRGGGPAPPAQSAAVEECGAVIAGSSAMSAKLAPAAVAAFLTRSGYAVAAPTPSEGGVVRVVGTRGDLRCTVAIRASTSTQGIQNLADASALIALSQRPLTRADIDMLRDAGAGDFAAERALAQHVVGFDAYALAVHQSNPLRAMGIDNVRDIAIGVKDNWSQAGGEDAVITLYSPRDGVMPQDYPNDLIQYPNPIWQRARLRAYLFDDEAAMVAALAQDPNGLGFVSAAFLSDRPEVRALDISAGGPPQAPTAHNVRAELYPLARRLFVFVRPADMAEGGFAQRFVQFFTSPQMFDVIDGAGFVALRPESRMSAAAASLSGCRYGTAEYAALLSATRGAERQPVELHFNPNTTVLDAEAQAYVDAQAEAFNQVLRGGGDIVLVGHADYTGEVQKNRELALRRALAVRAAFERHGLFGLEVESAGEQCPAADNDTEAGREANRRVEVWLRAAAAPAQDAAQP